MLRKSSAATLLDCQSNICLRAKEGKARPLPTRRGPKRATLNLLGPPGGLDSNKEPHRVR